MRWILLWCAQNQWLATHVPRWRFAQRAVRRFLPGEDFESALGAARELSKRGVGALFTRLGENVSTLDEATAVVEHYEAVLEAAAEIGAEISVKPTQLGLDVNQKAAQANLDRLAAAAERAKSFVWIDMEGSAYTDATLGLYQKLRAVHPNTGICLQAYLHRTVRDITTLLPFQPAIRLVKGAYAERAEIAFESTRDVDANYLALCVLMLPAVKRNGLKMVLGTHDVDLVKKVARFATAMGVERSQIEVNMLFGIRSADQLALAADGFKVKVLIAYGDKWYAWYLRRLAERPANVLFAARQLVG